MDTPRHVVGRVGAVLKAVAAHEPNGGTTSAVSRSAGLPRPTVHRLLDSLHDEGLVDRAPNGRWLLGPELYLLGTAATGRYDVTKVAQPFVRQLSLTSGESAFFSARRGHETVCLLREDGSFPIRSHVLYEGIRFPLGVASAGMAVLAYLADPEVHAYLDHTDLVTHYGAEHTSSLIWDRVRETRGTGYAVNPALIVEGSWGMAAAVFDSAGQARWALSLTGVGHRFATDRRPRLGRMLMDAAHQLTGQLRSPPPC